MTEDLSPLEQLKIILEVTRENIKDDKKYISFLETSLMNYLENNIASRKGKILLPDNAINYINNLSILSEELIKSSSRLLKNS